MKYCFKDKKLAFTLQEVLLSITIIAVIIMIAMPVTKSIALNRNKLGIKKANQTLHDTIQNILNDGMAYSGDNDFADTSSVVLYDDNNDNEVTVGGINKFSSVFFSKLKLANYSTQEAAGLDYEPCEMLVANDTTNKEGRCFRTEDNIVWGVPATDFRTFNVIKVDNNGYQVTYVPITVYPTFDVHKMQNDEHYFEDNAVFFAVRQDGDIRIMPQVDCDTEENKNKLQCKAVDYIAETSM